jgi:hypothetical protein
LLADESYEGSLHVRVLEARKLNIDFMEGLSTVTPSAFCILTTKTQVFNTNSIKKTKTCLWDEFFVFHLTTATKFLEATKKKTTFFAHVFFF